MMGNYKAVVIRNYETSKGSGLFHISFALNAPQGFIAQAGQFVSLEPLVGTTVMSRPFSIVSSSDLHFSLLIKSVGQNTSAYSELRKGQELNIKGPLGKPVPLGDVTDNCILVGGGVGAAALITICAELTRQGKKVQVLLGGREEKDIVNPDFFLEHGAIVYAITQKGVGKPGLVTDLLMEVLASDECKYTIITCGPALMLKRVAEIAAANGLKCMVMLEEIMACGMGACKGCAVFGNDETVKHVCEDGPSFDAEWIDWERFVPDRHLCIIEEKAAQLVSMETVLGKQSLQYPILNSSGCLSVEAIENGRISIDHLGALVTKGVTIMPRVGNAMPRVCEVPSGMINSIGLENKGIDLFISEELPRWLALGKPVIVNISGYSVAEYIEMAERLNDTDIFGIEVNISCPNIKKGGMVFGTDPSAASAVTQSVKRKSEKFVIVKLTPNVTDITHIARAVVDNGADAISLINTVTAMSIDPRTRKPKLANIFGGLSGPAIRAIAVWMVYKIYKEKLGLPIIGMGGIDSPEAAAEFVMAGADMVAVGTGAFTDRHGYTEINRGLRQIISSHGFQSIEEMVGSIIV